MCRVLRMIYAWLCWNIFSVIHKITYKTVVLVLTGENVLLDHYCIRYLDNFAQRKYAERKIVIYLENVTDPKYKKDVQFLKNDSRIKTIKMSHQWIELFYDLYSFYKFFDNIVFTFTSRPKENLLHRILAETNVDEEDAACLALYHLRCVPCNHSENQYYDAGSENCGDI